jgi:D-amino peptidase
VPAVFVSGDEGLCREVTALNDSIETVAVSQGIGDSTVSIAPQLAIKRIREGVESALKRNVSVCKIQLPQQFRIEIRFREHQKAYRASFYPGVTQTGPHTVSFETGDYFELLRMRSFTI